MIREVSRAELRATRGGASRRQRVPPPTAPQPQASSARVFMAVVQV